jgi:hypothetical protein
MSHPTRTSAPAHAPASSSRLLHHSESRSALVAKIADELRARSSPRVQLALIMAAAGGAGFLASVVMLWTDVEAFDRMTIRYPAAALCGYAAFVLLIRLWIAMQRSAPDPGGDVIGDVLEDSLDLGRLPSAFRDHAPEVRGVSGANVRRGVWDSVFDRSGGKSGWDVDVGDSLWLAVAAVCVLGGVSAIVYVVAIAPVLLAEIALDAAVVSVLYRRLRRDETGYWLTTVLTHTWIPAIVLVAFALLTGFALEQLAPDARSIGGVIRSLSA